VGSQNADSGKWKERAMDEDIWYPISDDDVSPVEPDDEGTGGLDTWDF
jgi:hypothetical protein